MFDVMMRSYRSEQLTEMVDPMEKSHTAYLNKILTILMPSESTLTQVLCSGSGESDLKTKICYTSP